MPRAITPKPRKDDASNAKSLRIIKTVEADGQGQISSPLGFSDATGRDVYRRRALRRLALLPDPWDMLAKRYVRNLESAGRSWGTIDSYLEALLRLVLFLGETGMPTDPENVTSEHIEEYFVRARRDGLSPNTLRIRFAGCRAFFAWAERVGEVRPSPMIGLTSMRPVEVLKATYSITDIQAMLDSCRDDFMGRRDKAAIMVLYDLGLRASEMLALTLDDVDLRNGVVFVRHPKGLRQRSVALGEACETALSKYLRVRKKIATRSTHLWTSPTGKPCTLEGLRSLVKRHGAQGLHKFRHSSATQARENGLDELDMLKTYGWTSLQMAQRYTRSRAEAKAIDAKRRYSPGSGLKV